MIRFALVLLLLPALAFGMAGFPPQDMTCGEQPFPNPSTQYIHCEFPPHISKFVTTDDMVAFPSALLIPRSPAKNTPIVAHFDGYNPRPFGQCDNYGFSDPAAIVTKNCPEPNDGTQLDWGGPNHGENAYGWRIAATAKYAHEHYQTIIDALAGITLQGCSYGGTTAILQSILMPDPWTKSLISVVDACVPNTLMVKQSAPLGMYWKNKAVRDAWGAFDWTQADIRTKASGRVYYKIVGSPVDNLVVFDLSIIPDVFEAQRIPGFVLWHDAGHVQGIVEVNYPWFDTYACPGMSHRLDQPQIAFTHSSENSPLDAPIGAYNLGWCWSDAGTIDTTTRTVKPIRYKAWKGVGAGIPDQLDSASVSVTVRNTKQRLTVGDQVQWVIGAQSGRETVTVAGEVTIPGITLQSSSTYSILTLTRM